MVALSGTTVISLEVVRLVIVKLPESCCPPATAVARICAGWVDALACVCTPTVAVPLASVTTVSVVACGDAGLLVSSAYAPKTTSKRIWMPAAGPPLGRRAETVALPGWPAARKARRAAGRA